MNTQGREIWVEVALMITAAVIALAIGYYIWLPQLEGFYPFELEQGELCYE